MGINKKFQEILNLLPVSKDIKKELVVRINELVDDLKGGGGDDPTNIVKIISVWDDNKNKVIPEIQYNNDVKEIVYICNSDYVYLSSDENCPEYLEENYIGVIQWQRVYDDLFSSVSELRQFAPFYLDMSKTIFEYTNDKGVLERVIINRL